MAPLMPAWRPLDDSPSTSLLSSRSGGGGVVALCISPTLAGTTEGASLALALTRGWAEEGLVVLLADGTVGTPSLHVPLGLTNGQGLADVLLAGLDWKPLTVPTGTPGLSLLRAGGSEASAASHDALKQLSNLCRDVSADGSLLVLFVPLGSMVTEWALAQSTDILVLAAEGEAMTPFFAPDEDRIRALLGPSSTATVIPAPRDGTPAIPADQVPTSIPDRTPDPVRDPTRDPGPVTVTHPIPDLVLADAPEAPRARTRRSRKSTPERTSTERIEDAWAKAAAEVRATQKSGSPPSTEDKP